MRNPMLIGALGLGLVAAIGTFFVVSRKGAKARSGADSTKTVKAEEIIAKTYLYPHTRIRPDMVESTAVETEKKKIDPALCQSLDEVIDHVVLSQVAPGEKLYRDNVSGVQGQTARSVVSFEVPQAKRAYSVLLDPSADTAGFAQVGDFVDVMVVYEWETRAFCRTIVQNVQVIATELLGQVPEQQSEASGESKEEKGGKKPTRPTKRPTPAPGTLQLKIVLAVDLEQAQQIAAAQQKGEITLTIRNAEDRDELPIEPSFEQPKAMKTADELEKEQQRRARPREQEAFARALGGLVQAPPMPPPMPPAAGEPKPAPSKTVEIVRGTERETVTVSE